MGHFASRSSRHQVSETRPRGFCRRSLPTPLNLHVQSEAGLPFCVTPVRS
jgi:hypothetical protein